MPDVTQGFLQFARARAPPTSFFRCVFGCKTGRSFDSTTGATGWKTALSTLDVCWQRESAEVSADAELGKAFVGLLSTLVSRGGHAAIALEIES